MDRMLRVALRGIRAHAVRFALSVLAVLLGVAFVVGTFAFRGVLSSTFHDIIATQFVADAYVRGSAPTESDDITESSSGPSGGSGSFAPDRNLIPISLTDSINKVDGVQRAVPDISGSVVLVGSDGQPVLTNGPPSRAFAVDPDDPSLTLVSGSWPGAGQIVIDRDNAKAAGLHTGDKTQIVLSGTPQNVTVSGVFRITTAAGAVFVGIDQDTAQHAFAPDGKISQIAVYADPGLTEQELSSRLSKALPAADSAQAVTGETMRSEAQESVDQILGFIQTFLLIFAAIALFVGAFIIANTFAMSVRERMREFGLLRAVGASPIQVFGSVLAQAAVVGLVGGGLGVAAGAGLVRVIKWGLQLAGMPFPGAATLSAGQIGFAIVLGTVISLVAAAFPARKAALVPPVQAMHDDVAPERGNRSRAIGGVALTLLGAVTLVVASRSGSAVGGLDSGWSLLDDASPRLLLGIGAGLVLIGVLVTSPALARPVIRVLAWPTVIGLRPLGRLARGNVTRSPRRTAATAGALLIGMALVAVTGVIASSTSASVRSIVDNEVQADLVVDSPTWSVPRGAVDAVRGVPGTSSVDVVRLGSAAVSSASRSQPSPSSATATSAPPSTSELPSPGTTASPPVTTTTTPPGTTAVNLSGVPVGFFSRSLHPVTVSGNPATALANGEVVVVRNTARQHGWQVGDRLRIGPPSADVAARIGAVIDSQLVGSGIVAPDQIYDRVVPTGQQTVRIVYVNVAPGSSVAAVRSQLISAVQPYLIVTVRDREEAASAYADQVDQVLAILYALLALSIVIALLGIVNTLALSVTERTREIGLLRAVGLGRMQLAGTIAIEAVLTAVYGTVLGVATGIGIGAALPGVLAEQGLNTLSIPWGQVGLILVLAVVIGLVASVWPAIRATRLPVLDAVSEE